MNGSSSEQVKPAVKVRNLLHQKRPAQPYKNKGKIFSCIDILQKIRDFLFLIAIVTQEGESYKKLIFV